MTYHMSCPLALLLLAGCGSEDNANLRAPDNHGEEVAAPTEAQEERFQAIARVKKLGGHYRNVNERLTFAGAEIANADLEVVKSLPELERLSLSGTDVSDAGLSHIEGLAHLRELNLSGTQVTDEGLRSLKHLPSLRSLSLMRTEVSDEGLQHIMGFTQLRMLSISKGQVSDAAIDVLGKALPECDVVRH